MLLFRSVSTGLLGACLVMLASPPAPRPWFHPPPGSHARHAAHVPQPEVTLVDIAPGIAGDALPALLHLGIDERVLAVDDAAVADDLAAGALLAERSAVANHRSFIDLTVGTTQHGRRVLLLLH